MGRNVEISSMPPVVWEAGIAEGQDQRDDFIQSVLGLAEEGIPVRLRPSSFEIAPDGERDSELAMIKEIPHGRPREDGRYVSVLHAGPESFARDESADYCIGRTAVGTLRLPERLANTAGAFDEIWVPSGFSRMAFAASGMPEERIRIIPSCVDAEAFRPAADSPRVDRDRGFVFLTALDWDYARGLDIVLEAYAREFRGDEDVSLILKAPEGPLPASLREKDDPGPAFWSDLESWLFGHLRDRDGADDGEIEYEALISAVADSRLGDDLRRAREIEKGTAEEIKDAIRDEMKRRGADLADIKVVSRALPRHMAPGFYSACDAFVMAPRAEIWGRPFLEAMAVGLPTIGTRWGGHLDFMSPDNSYLIRVRSLISIDDGDELGRDGLCLAEPDVKHLRELMRRVYEHRSDAREQGARGSAHVRAKHSRVRVASLMAERLACIVNEHGLAVAVAA